MALEKYSNLKTLILDHNNVSNLRYMPALPSLETLSLAYNQLKDLDLTVFMISRNVSNTNRLLQLVYIFCVLVCAVP